MKSLITDQRSGKYMLQLAILTADREHHRHLMHFWGTRFRQAEISRSVGGRDTISALLVRPTLDSDGILREYTQSIAPKIFIDWSQF